MSVSRRTFAALSGASLALPLAPALAASPQENVLHGVLSNGLEVIALPDHRAPVVTHMLWYRVGSADEQPGKTGLAHFLEHLMFKGTARHPEGAFSRVIRDVGGVENAFTSFDYTGYFQRVAREHLGTMMAHEADRMTGLILTDDKVDPERQVVIEERKSSIDNNPGSRLSERISAALWGQGHPYAHAIIGHMRDIEGLTREDALAFYRQHYAPNNAVLVVAGDVTFDEVMRLAGEHYGPQRANPAITPRTRPPGPSGASARRVRLADDRVRQPNLTQVWLAPSYATAAPGEAEALDLLAEIAGSRPNGRVFRELVTEKELATSAGLFYSGGALGQGRIGVFASPRPGISLDRIEAALRQAVEPLALEGVSDAEFARARTRLIAQTIFAQDSQSTQARTYGSALTSGTTVRDVLEWPDRIRAVTRDQVRAAAARFRFDEALTAELVRA